MKKVAKKESKKLTPAQEAFCIAYAETNNGSESYRRAYPKSRTWAESAIHPAASRLLASSKVSARVAELRQELAKSSQIKKEDVLAMLHNIMYADIRDFLEVRNNNVYFKDSSEWTDKMAMQVEIVKQTKEGVEIKLNGKAWTISRICKMLGYDTPTEMNIKHMLANINTGTDD